MADKCQKCLHLAVCGKYEYDEDRKNCADYYEENSRIANQREEINRLQKRIHALEQSRLHWQNTAKRLGRQLNEVLYRRKEE